MPGTPARTKTSDRREKVKVRLQTGDGCETHAAFGRDVHAHQLMGGCTGFAYPSGSALGITA